MSRRGVAGLAVAAVAGLLAALAAAVFPLPPEPFGAADPPTVAPARVARFSLLALGDTGERHAWPALREGQLAVARGLVAEDLRAPADGLLLLGDNFYPRGLERAELVERIRLNLVWPYCRFADLSAPKSARVADACRLRPALRRAQPIPIHAVLGNHDHKSPESPALQRREIPLYLANWRLARGLVEVRQPAPGVSLVLVDTPSVRGPAEAEQVRAALAATPGPWRIVAGHEPIAQARGGVPWPSAALLRRALRESGRPVQLYLSGHGHNLQLIPGRGASPALHVIAGSGATRRESKHEFEGAARVAAETGFARIDLLPVAFDAAGASGDPAAAGGSGAGGEALEVSLFATPRYPVVFWPAPRLLARWRIQPTGDARPTR